MSELITTIIALVTFSGEATAAELINFWVTIIFVLSFSGFNILKKKKQNKSDDKHEGCVNHPSLLSLISDAISKTAKATEEIAYVKKSMLHAQMSEALITWIEVSDLLKDNYYKEISLRAVPEHDREKGIRHFNLIVDNMKIMVMDILRAWMKRGEFIDKTEIEFQAYIEDKVKILMPKISSAIDQGYMRSILWIDMRTLRESSLICMDPIGSAASKLFHKARGIAIEKRKLIEKIKGNDNEQNIQSMSS